MKQLTISIFLLNTLLTNSLVFGSTEMVELDSPSSSSSAYASEIDYKMWQNVFKKHTQDYPEIFCKKNIEAIAGSLMKALGHQINTQQLLLRAQDQKFARSILNLATDYTILMHFQDNNIRESSQHTAVGEILRSFQKTSYGNMGSYYQAQVQALDKISEEALEFTRSIDEKASSAASKMSGNGLKATIIMIKNFRAFFVQNKDLLFHIKEERHSFLETLQTALNIAQPVENTPDTLYRHQIERAIVKMSSIQQVFEEALDAHMKEEKKILTEVKVSNITEDLKVYNGKGKKGDPADLKVTRNPIYNPNVHYPTIGTTLQVKSKSVEQLGQKTSLLRPTQSMPAISFSNNS